jgi:phenylalanyl-tRNA synthetase alpha chain
VTNFNLDAFVADLESLRSEVEQALSEVSGVESLETARVAFLGAKNGRLKAIQKGLGKLGREDKPARRSLCPDKITVERCQVH